MNDPENLRFETERLSLRPPRFDDVAELSLMLRDPKVVFWRHGLPPLSLKTVRDRIGHSRKLNARGLGYWLVIERDSGEIAGNVMLQPLPDSFEIELGYLFRKPLRRKGYAT